MTFMTRSRTVISALVACTMLASGCATLVSRPSQRVPITSVPPGAVIIADGKNLGLSPLTLQLSRKRPHVIEIRKDGFNVVEIRVERTRANNGFLTMTGNFFLGLAAGFAVHFVVWQAKGRPDEDMTLTGDLLAACLLTWIGSAVLDGSTGARHKLTPGELNVTLTKSTGDPVRETVRLDPAEFRDLRWIRVRTDGGPLIDPY